MYVHTTQQMIQVVVSAGQTKQQQQKKHYETPRYPFILEQKLDRGFPANILTNKPTDRPLCTGVESDSVLVH